MHRDVAEKWVKALRSGEYRQGAGYLRDKDNRHCCLGVLCDVYAKETGKGVWTGPEGHALGFRFAAPHDSAISALPLTVQTWAGMRNEEGQLPLHVELFEPASTVYGTSSPYLTTINDSGKFGFDRIADLIDTYADDL